MGDQREQEIRGLGEKIEERKAAQKRLEPELRNEFQNKLNDFVGQKASQYEEEKNEWMKIFKDEYNKKIQAYKQANRALGGQIRNLHTDKKQKLDTILQKKSQIAQLTQNRRAIEADIDAQRSMYDSTTKTIRDLKAALARKAQEFDELLAARISLEAEVQRYARLVSDEEGRVGLAT